MSSPLTPTPSSQSRNDLEYQKFRADTNSGFSVAVVNPDGSNLSGGVVTVASPSAIGDGLKLVTTAGTAEKLSASTIACKSITITAKITNTGTVVIGGSTVVAASGATRRGIPLLAGDSMVIDIDDVSKVYADVTVSGEGVTYTYTA